MNAQLDYIDHGIVHDLSGLSKPLAAVNIRNRCREYIVTMNLIGKPCRAVTVTVAQYSALFEAAHKGRDKDAPPHCRPVAGWRAGAEVG